jgi:N-acetylglutamate synthase-like GNAT family acetyltransferase
MNPVWYTRDASINDTDFVRSLHRTVYNDVIVEQFGEWNKSHSEYFDKIWIPENFKILTCDGVDFGALSVFDRDDHMYLDEIMIHPEFQNQGIGTSILSDLISKSEAKKIPIKLGTLVKSPSQDLYKKVGFKEVGRDEIIIKMEYSPN